METKIHSNNHWIEKEIQKEVKSISGQMKTKTQRPQLADVATFALCGMRKGRPR